MDLFSYAATAPLPQSGKEQKISGEEQILSRLRTEKLDSGGRFHLRNEAYILRLAYAYNKILSLSNSRTSILSHQVESTHRIVNALRQRFLIADEVGLGKTVEAGLVIKELIYRYDYKRVLIACPASLLYQWQNEMQSKFNERFVIMNRSLLKKAVKEAEQAKGGGAEAANPWNVHNKIICSLDFIKNAAFAEDLAAVHWDAVVFDEAHRLRRDSAKSTLAYNAAEKIAEHTNALLLLSATPFRGKLEELYYLIGLLDKNILGPFQTFYQDYCLEEADTSTLKQKLSEVLIRRTKREIGGFTKRYAKTVRFELYPDERALYDETTKYVAEEFNRAMQSENRAVGFVMTVFQKLLDSSSFALTAALAKRQARLEELVKRGEAGELFAEGHHEENGDSSDCDEADDRFFAEHSEKTIEELKAEINTIGRLIALGEKITANKKSEKLVELIASLKRQGKSKFLIFTQFRTTQDYLANALAGYKTVVFNGSMSGSDKEQAIIDFKEKGDILIATEAGGEGRNIQFCNILINYDLPWSPLKVEQRIGRLHRFGQTQDVFIYNFSTADTVAERVLNVLEHKLKLFEDSIGSPDIMLGEIEDEINLTSLFMDYAAKRRKTRELDAEIERRVNVARENYKKLASLTVSGRMDFNYDEYYKITMQERRFSNRRIERFVNRLVTEDETAAGMFPAKKLAGGLYKIPCEGAPARIGTFDSQRALEKEELEFFAFGHKVIDRLVERAVSPEFGGFTGVKAVKIGKPCVGLLCAYVVSYKSVKETREFIPVVVPITGELSESDIGDLEWNAFESPDAGCTEAQAAALLKEAEPRLDELFAEARQRLTDKIKRRTLEISDDLDFNISPQLDKIKTSYNKTVKELEDKLELQQSRMKWYGADLKGAITRTSNQIMKTKQERERAIAEYKSYLGIETSAEMVSAGFIISS